MQVTIYGPNLPRQYQDLGEMHVHAAGCRHASRFPDRGWTTEADTRAEVAEEIYPSDEFEGEPEDFLMSIHFGPCVRDLA